MCNIQTIGQRTSLDHPLQHAIWNPPLAADCLLSQASNSLQYKGLQYLCLYSLAFGNLPDLYLVILKRLNSHLCHIRKLMLISSVTYFFMSNKFNSLHLPLFLELWSDPPVVLRLGNFYYQQHVHYYYDHSVQPLSNARTAGCCRCGNTVPVGLVISQYSS